MVYDISYHDDETMQKVYKALQSIGLDDKTTVDAVMAMQNSGILFRETVMNKTLKLGDVSPEEGHIAEKPPPADSPFTNEAMRGFWEREVLDP
jgi:hypothetical protein